MFAGECEREAADRLADREQTRTDTAPAQLWLAWRRPLARPWPRGRHARRRDAPAPLVRWRCPVPSCWHPAPPSPPPSTCPWSTAIVSPVRARVRVRACTVGCSVACRWGARGAYVCVHMHKYDTKPNTHTQTHPHLGKALALSLRAIPIFQSLEERFLFRQLGHQHLVSRGRLARVRILLRHLGVHMRLLHRDLHAHTAGLSLAMHAHRSGARHAPAAARACCASARKTCEYD